MREKSILLLAAILLHVYLVSVSSAAVPSFQGLGDLPGNEFYSEAYGISSNGKVVVGASQSVKPDPYSSKATEAFIWTASGGMIGLGDLPGGELSSQAKAASADGSVVVGYGKPDWPGFEAFRWTQSGGMVGLGHLGDEYSTATDVSSDGSVIVGCSLSSSGPMEAFRWTESGGMVGLGFLPGGSGDYFDSIANAISADGSVIVGTDNSTEHYRAFKWTEGSGMTCLAPELDYDNYARDISADGLVIVGDYFDGNKSFAIRWTAEDGMVGLGEIPGHTTTYSTAYAASADGSVIVGGNNDWFGPYSGDEAFIWDEIYGMRNLQDMLENNCGLDLSGWTLTEARGISADGLTIAGTGINPNGDTEAWIATVPEPATLFLLGLGSLALLRKRKK